MAGKFKSNGFFFFDGKLALQQDENMHRKQRKKKSNNKLQEKALVSQKFFYFLFLLKFHIFRRHPPRPAWCLLEVLDVPSLGRGRGRWDQA